MSKVYGFLVAVESDVEPSKEFIESAICYYMDDDYEIWGKAKVDVESLGEIEVYPEDEKYNNGIG